MEDFFFEIFHLLIVKIVFRLLLVRINDQLLPIP